jgi:predicted nucleotidyltransferase
MGVTGMGIEKGIEILRAHGAKRVVLFGSALERGDEARDIDFAVEGIEPSHLLDGLPVLVDLVDLSDDTPFTRHIRKRGRVVFESE